MNGVPCNMEDEETAGTAQPPFLLRWSPAFFAERLPDVFEWDRRTNRLSLQPQHRHRPPWKAGGHPKQQSTEASWLYCDRCHTCLFGKAESEQSHIPFRDQSSVDALRGDVAAEAAASPAFSAPKELRRRWQAARSRAARQNRPARKKLDHDDLVPVPQPQYWQDAPEAPCHLSCCNLHSSMEVHGDEKRRAAYVCSAGETSFWRRQPKQFTSTLAFMYGRDEGEVFRVRAGEVEPLRECLQWLRECNPLFKVFWSAAERFGTLYRNLQAIIPRGDGETRVRMQRNRHNDDAVATTLGETLGAEAAVLIIIDPGELPQSWASIEALAGIIGEEEYRLEVDVKEAAPLSAGSPDDAYAASAPILSATKSSLIQRAAAELRQKSMVTLGDCHLDAKLLPHLHPYGSGSLRAEEGSGGMQRYAKNRLCSLEDAFRHSAVWSFWMLERLIKNDLYFKERRRRAASSAQQDSPSAASAAPDIGTASSAPDGSPGCGQSWKLHLQTKRSFCKTIVKIQYDNVR